MGRWLRRQLRTCPQSLTETTSLPRHRWLAAAIPRCRSSEALAQICPGLQCSSSGMYQGSERSHPAPRSGLRWVDACGFSQQLPLLPNQQFSCARENTGRWPWPNQRDEFCRPRSGDCIHVSHKRTQLYGCFSIQRPRHVALDPAVYDLPPVAVLAPQLNMGVCGQLAANLVVNGCEPPWPEVL